MPLLVKRQNEERIIADAILRAKLKQLRKTTRLWVPFDYQRVPDGDWDIWLFLAGRGAGKTRTAAEFVLDHLNEFGSKARVGIGAPTLGAVRDVCAEGDSGLITIAPEEFKYNRSLLEARHIKGGYVKFLGSERPQRWNGPQWTLLWADELALWRQESWDQAQFGVRLGLKPRIIASTTPKNKKFIKDLLKDPAVAVSRGKTKDNTALAQSAVARLLARYSGTRLGRQELDGDFVDDVEGAYWSRDVIEKTRHWPTAPNGGPVFGNWEISEKLGLKRIVVAIDPATTASATSDFTGIVVAGIDSRRHRYILHSEAMKLPPYAWAKRAIQLYDMYQADRIIGEVNNGGDMVRSTIENIRDTIPFTAVHASRGKETRAEPKAAYYEKGYVHHVGPHPELEDQMCAFPIENDNDDLVDALVWSLEALDTGRTFRAYA